MFSCTIYAYTFLFFIDPMDRQGANAGITRNQEKNPSMYVVHALACGRSQSLHACPHAKA